MKDDLKKQKWNTAAGATAASHLEKILRDEFDKTMESFSDLHPVLKMYFDSELSSGIENNAFLAISDAILSTVDDLTQEGILSQFHDLGMSIAHIACKRLYMLKLIYHANKGWISKEQFCQLSVEHLAIETAAVVNKLWDLLPAAVDVGTTFLLTICGMDPISAKHISDKINNIILTFHPFIKRYITQEKIETLLKYVMDFTVTSARHFFVLVEKVGNKFKSWGRAIYNTFNWKIPKFLEEKKPIEINDPNNKFKTSKRKSFVHKPINITINKPDVEIEK